MQKKWLALIVVAVVLLLFLGPPVSNFLNVKLVPAIGDAMEWRSRWLAGRHGVDCGRVRIGGDPRAATACALQAQAEGKPFRVRYDIMGIDSAVAGGVVRTPDGRLYGLSFDGNPTGAGGTSLFRQRVSQLPCPSPPRLWVNPKGRVNCFQQQLSQPDGITAPNIEPY
jgi:hypothetical protein